MNPLSLRLASNQGKAIPNLHSPNLFISLHCPLSLRSAQIYFNIFLFATDIYEKSHKLVHTAISSVCGRRVIGTGIGQWHWAWGNASAWNCSRSSCTNTRSEKESEKEGGAEALMRLPYWLLTSTVGHMRAGGSGAQGERAATPYKSFFLLLLFPRT